MPDSPIPPTFDPILTDKEAAPLLGIKLETLAAWRHHKRYDLPYVRVGRCIRYRLSDLNRFLERNTVCAVSALKK